MTSFLCKLDPKNNFLEVLELGFGTAGLQHKLLTVIESPNVFHWKSTKKVKCVVCGAKSGPNFIQCCEKTKKNWYFSGFFDIFHEV